MTRRIPYAQVTEKNHIELIAGKYDIILDRTREHVDDGVHYGYYTHLYMVWVFKKRHPPDKDQVNRTYGGTDSLLDALDEVQAWTSKKERLILEQAAKRHWPRWEEEDRPKEGKLKQMREVKTESRTGHRYKLTIIDRQGQETKLLGFFGSEKALQGWAHMGFGELAGS